MPHTSSPPRRLRDVSDVEQYVRGTVAQVAPEALSTRDVLLAHGVQAVLRVERALPPGVPLLPVLDEVLPSRLAAISHTFRPVAAVA